MQCKIILVKPEFISSYLLPLKVPGDEESALLNDLHELVVSAFCNEFELN
jgi:hypothetical protein